MFNQVEKMSVLRAFRNLSIGSKVVGLVLFLLIATSVLLGFMYQKISLMGSTINTVATIELVLAKDISDIALEQGRQAVLLERSVRNGQNVLYDESLREVVKDAKVKFEALTVSISRKLNKSEQLISGLLKKAKSKKRHEELEYLASEIKKIENSHQAYISLGDKLFRAALENLMHDIDAIVVAVEKAERQVHTMAKKFLGTIQLTTKSSAEKAAKEEEFIQRFLMIAAPIIIIVFLLLALAFSRLITRQLGQVIAVGERISRGDLTASLIKVETWDEAGKVASVMQTMSERLRKFVSSVSEGSRLVNNVAGEMVNANKLLSERTAKQAKVLEETAASVEELTSSVKHSSENINAADKLAALTRNQAGIGVDVGDEAIKAISELEESNHKIEQIIQVIDDIAFQTNLLALNAAVEAARAGEQGRGFSVVASEVRSLAGRSAESAKEIKALIKSGAERMKVGSEKVHACGDAFNEVLKSGEEAAHVVSQILKASEDQKVQIEWLNQAIMEIDKIGQQNAHMVEDTKITGRTLEQQAERMDKIVSFYKLEESEIRPNNKNQYEEVQRKSDNLVHWGHFKDAS